MDALTTAVIRLHEQGLSLKEIGRRAGCSEQKARKLLITAGLYETAMSRKIAELAAQGFTPEQIAAKVDMTTNAVLSYLPYTKGQYNAEYPSVNALRIRKSRTKRAAAAQNKETEV